MSQQYELKDGYWGHFVDAYKEKAIDALSEMPKGSVRNYIEDLLHNYEKLDVKDEKLEEAYRIICAKDISFNNFKKSIELLADVEYKRRFFASEEIRDATKKVMEGYGRVVW